MPVKDPPKNPDHLLKDRKYYDKKPRPPCKGCDKPLPQTREEIDEILLEDLT